MVLRSCEGRSKLNYKVSSPYKLFKLSCIWLFDRSVT